MSRADRIFRRLLRLFPAEFRGDFGDEMTDTFREQRRDTPSGLKAHAALWWDTVRGVLTTAPREHWDLLTQDVRYGLRNLRRSPGFTIIAVAALAAGIGANSAVFSIVNGVLLEPLPYQAPRELVMVFEDISEGKQKFGFSPPDFAIVRGAATSLAGMAAFRNATYELSGIDRSERIIGTRVSPELFGVLGVEPAIGRAFTPAEDAASARVAIITYGLWSRAFGRDPAILGRTVALDRQPYTVIGVMPERFEFPPRGGTLNAEPAALLVPIAYTPLERRSFGAMYNSSVVARLKPGVTIDQARADLDRARVPLAEAYPAPLRGLGQAVRLPVASFADEVVGTSRRLILVLMAAVGLVLLIGCADVANLMLTRSAARQRELGIRSALGASPARVVRQLLTEGLVLGVLGAAAGGLLAYGTMNVFLSLAGDTLPRVESIAFDARVVLFTFTLALLTPMIFGVIPALRTALGSNASGLKEHARGATAGPGRHRLLAGLVVAQFALALILSVGAGLLLRSFSRLMATDPGFRAAQAVNASVTLPRGRYADGRLVKEFYQQAVDAARAIPGVIAAGASTDRPLRIREQRVFTPDPTSGALPSNNRTTANTWTVGQYFQSLDIPLKRGRYFSEEDGRQGERVIILGDLLARSLWPDQDPLGRRIKWGIESSPNPWMTVVGVVGDIKPGSIATETTNMTYEPFVQAVPDQMRGLILSFFSDVNVVIRSSRPSDQLMADLRGVFGRLDAALPPPTVKPVVDIIDDSVRPQRFSMTVIAAFAGLALVLSGIGIYGVLASAVLQQRQEIGVRLALGASATGVFWMVLRRALLLMAAGVAIGVGGAWFAARLMAGLLFEIRATDVTTFVAATIVLALLAVAASLVPAWRASRVDPLAALRES